MLKKGDIVYKISLDGHSNETRSVAVERYKVRQRVSSKTEEGESDCRYQLERVLRSGASLYVGDYMSEVEETRIQLGVVSYRDDFIFVFDEKDIPAARKQILKNNIDNLQAEINSFKRLLEREKDGAEK